MARGEYAQVKTTPKQRGARPPRFRQLTGILTLLGRTKLRHNCKAMPFQRQKVSGLVAMLVDGGRRVVSGLLSFRRLRASESPHTWRGPLRSQPLKLRQLGQPRTG